MTDRLVVVLCGPPGAGKTTIARASGLTVYDRDDEQWHSERHFTTALAALSHTPDARAVVIRAGATSSARAHARTLTAATHVYLVTGDDHARRITRRDRTDRDRTIAAVTRWHHRHDNADHTPPFPGWADLLGHATSETW